MFQGNYVSFMFEVASTQALMNMKDKVLSLKLSDILM